MEVVVINKDSGIYVLMTLLIITNILLFTAAVLLPIQQFYMLVEQ
jgi:hypothetical protein